MSILFISYNQTKIVNEAWCMTLKPITIHWIMLMYNDTITGHTPSLKGTAITERKAVSLS